MPLAYALITPATAEPVTVAELERHARIATTDEAAELALYIAAARADVERFLHRQLMPATWTLYCDGFADSMSLPHSPVSSVSSVQYLDADGDLQTLAVTIYQTDLISEPARVLLAEDQEWPDTQGNTVHTVRITYVAGYTDRFAVPAPIRLAILHQASDLYEHREARIDIEGSTRSIESNPVTEQLLSRYRIPVLA